MADSQKYGRTANLFNYVTMATGMSGYYLKDDGTVMQNASWIISDYIPCDGTVFTINPVGGNTPAICLYDNNKNFISGKAYNTGGAQTKGTVTITATQTAKYIRFTYQTTMEVPDDITAIMLNEGSTALPFQPYYGWQHSLRKLTTATEAVENPLYSDGTAITSYTIKGNTVQDGTATPSNPVEVNGVGERTENLFDDHNVITVSVLGDRYGVELPSGIYSIYNDTDNIVYYGVNNFGDRQIACEPHSTATIRLTIAAGTVGGVFMPYNSGSQGGCTVVTGSTPPDHYIPYGYKIPISSGQQTTNIYLGSTQTVRQIKKYVMTGNETISNYASDFQRYVITIPTMPSMGTRLTPIICTHYIGIYDGRPAEQVPMNAVYTGSATDNSVLIKTDQTTDRSTFIAWLQEQYANGTPVTLWYAVSTAETAAVNEPLMKIGTYADTLSNATAIPTTEGANSITVDTTVQPSEFTATWTGWHNTSVKEWDGSDWS